VQALVLVAALVTLLLLPCFVAMAVRIDDLVEGVHRPFAGWRERRSLGRLDRALDQPEVQPAALAALDEPGRTTIGEIAVDLRRLGRQRLGVATRSPVWHGAVQRAYDEKLRLACEALEVEEHLGELVGVDLEIERVRVEGELQGAGLMLESVQTDRRQDQL
jgi:hypothetical protein